MEMNTKDIARYELIGLNAEIIDSKNKSNIGIKGKIADETKSTIIINNKRVFKKNITLKIKTKNQSITIKGEKLFGRPKERTKKWSKKKRKHAKTKNVLFMEK